ncbi:hypothetical protein N7466_010519 [Penicillium verhagenii]|uniref:uncharacterized protein n=1 Tax=Penicillium verhagenii TaxID=1562060 RepID=UPI00254512FD|nr:uncharacterized protein N7466_010519 [Penicillium verhagenii]KAJ5918527.1 hypothetical protein N7466_010519 [Penicillium verhagenii]
MKLNARQSCRNLVRILFSPSLWFDVYWPKYRKYWFSLLFIGVVSAKLLHIYSHLNSLTVARFLLWGPTFFLQDIICIAVAYAICQEFQRKWIRVLTAFVGVLSSLLISGIAAANISFYIKTGAEIHWRQAHSFHRDAASVKTLLTGLTGIVIGEILFSLIAWVSGPSLYNLTDNAFSILKNAIAPLYRRLKKDTPEKYEQVNGDDWQRDEFNDAESQSMLGLHKSKQTFSSKPSFLTRTIFVSATIYMLVLRLLRPSDDAYGFLSQTVIITPFESSPGGETTSVNIPDLPGDYSWLYNHTALGEAPHFDWLPAKELAGFRDWYKDADGKQRQHYDPLLDPLHISNLDRDIIEPLRDTLRNGNVSIKHVLLIKLESTRADVFPVRKESYLADLIQESYSDKKIPEDVEKRLATLTHNAERFTGVQSGFGNEDETFQPYGGIFATNAYTSDTFTLKSILASVCGIAPLVVDFNKEYLHHIYEPCMPQIFNALNLMPNATKSEEPHQYKTWPWHSIFMQSITDNYDNQNHLIPAMGFDEKITDKTITKDWKKKKGKGNPPEKFNFWGYPEHELRGYLSRALLDAETHQKRLFLTHLTGQTHYPWDMPVGDKYEKFMPTSIFNHNKRIGKYLNTLGVADRWLGEILEVLEETGVIDETLIVMVGDHGLSIIEDGGATPYDNPHISNFHVPLVFSHPQLPPIKVDGRVHSMQILPTILDLLVESGSLDEEATHAIKDLLPLYEGQSIIRDLVPQKDGRQDWQFTVMNTGGTWLALRSASTPYRLIIPLVQDVEWRFTDVDVDPHEFHTLQSFSLIPLLEDVAKVHGEAAVEWIKEAAHVTQWWVSENWRRYEYVPEN